jgi:hypothetical protein
MRNEPHLATAEQETSTAGPPSPPTDWTVEVQTANSPPRAYAVVNTTTMPDNSNR